MKKGRVYLANLRVIKIMRRAPIAMHVLNVTRRLIRSFAFCGVYGIGRIKQRCIANMLTTECFREVLVVAKFLEFIKIWKACKSCTFCWLAQYKLNMRSLISHI